MEVTDEAGEERGRDLSEGSHRGKEAEQKCRHACTLTRILQTFHAFLRGQASQRQIYNSANSALSFAA